MTKREYVMDVVRGTGRRKYVPVAFFRHFSSKLGADAAREHISYYRETDMDIAKIQFEQFPAPCISEASDIAKIPVFGKDYWRPQLFVVEKVTESLVGETMVFSTLYSPFIFFQNMFGLRRPREVISMMTEDMETTRRALDNIMESIVNYMEAAVQLGIDGFFISTQGADNQFLSGTTLWKDLFSYYDEKVHLIAQELAGFNILHICDMRKRYEEIDSFARYPDCIVNPPVRLKDGYVDMKQVYECFNRAVMGGVDRNGTIVNGDMAEVISEVDRAILSAPERFILSADCTLPGTVEIKRLREIVDYSHVWHQVRG